MYWQSPHPYIFFTLYREIASLRAAAEFAPITAVINVMHKYLFYTLITMTSLQFTHVQSLGYTRGMNRVPLSIQT